MSEGSPRLCPENLWGARGTVPDDVQHPVSSRKAEGKAASTTELPPEYLTSPLSQQSQVLPGSAGAPRSWARLTLPCHPQLPPKRDETALQEEEELQLALALSQSEAEEKERMVSRGWPR